MAVAIISPEGMVLSVHAKPNPYMNIPAGGRMLGYNPPEFDPETEEVAPVEPVQQDVQDVAFSVTAKQADVVEAVRVQRIQAQIDALERQALMPRIQREYMLLDFGDKLTALGQNPEDNPAYRKLHALEMQINALRAQL